MRQGPFPRRERRDSAIPIGIFHITGNLGMKGKYGDEGDFIPRSGRVRLSFRFLRGFSRSWKGRIPGYLREIPEIPAFVPPHPHRWRQSLPPRGGRGRGAPGSTANVRRVAIPPHAAPSPRDSGRQSGVRGCPSLPLHGERPGPSPEFPFSVPAGAERRCRWGWDRPRGPPRCRPGDRSRPSGAFRRRRRRSRSGPARRPAWPGP